MVIFMEVHEDPEHALSDGPNSYPLAQLRAAARTSSKRLDEVARAQHRRAREYGKLSVEPHITASLLAMKPLIAYNC